jgi:hypothetical protein
VALRFGNLCMDHKNPTRDACKQTNKQILMIFKVLKKCFCLGQILMNRPVQVAQTPDGAEQPLSNFYNERVEETCPAQTIRAVLDSSPKCIPRYELIKLPTPDSSEVVEVIPSHILVQKCGGACHDQNLYHKCVPDKGARITKTVEVNDIIDIKKFFNNYKVS